MLSKYMIETQALTMQTQDKQRNLCTTWGEAQGSDGSWRSEGKSHAHPTPGLLEHTCEPDPPLGGPLLHAASL